MTINDLLNALPAEFADKLQNLPPHELEKLEHKLRLVPAEYKELALNLIVDMLEKYDLRNAVGNYDLILERADLFISDLNNSKTEIENEPLPLSSEKRRLYEDIIKQDTELYDTFLNIKDTTELSETLDQNVINALNAKFDEITNIYNDTINLIKEKLNA